MADKINNVETKLLQLTQQQASHIIAALLIIGFLIFMTGYYVGKKIVYSGNIYQSTVDSTLQSSASNFVNAAINLTDNLGDDRIDFDAGSEINNLNNVSNNTDLINTQIVNVSNNVDRLEKIDSRQTRVVESAQDAIIQADLLKSDLAKIDQVNTKNNFTKKYCGQLAGFGTRKAAQKYLNDIERRGFEARLVERKSKSVKGLERVWYQVTTLYFDRKEALEELILQMKKVKLCNSVEIVTITN